MGSNPALALSVLQDQAAYWRWLAARCIVIGSIIGVACAAGVMSVGIGNYPWSEIIWACALVAVLPIGVLPVAAWLGILFPYHPRSLRWRWQQRRAWRTHLRWAVLVFAPFFYVPVIGVAILAPGVELARSSNFLGSGSHQPSSASRPPRLRHGRSSRRPRSLGGPSAPGLADQPLTTYLESAEKAKRRDRHHRTEASAAILWTSTPACLPTTCSDSGSTYGSTQAFTQPCRRGVFLVGSGAALGNRTPDLRITRTPSRVDSGPDQAL